MIDGIKYHRKEGNASTLPGNVPTKNRHMNTINDMRNHASHVDCFILSRFLMLIFVLLITGFVVAVA